MAKNRKKKSPTPQKSSSDTEVETKNKTAVNIEEINLRTAGPVTRLRGVMAVAAEKLATVEGKLSKWSVESSQSGEIAEVLTNVLSEVQSVMEQLESLELSGFSPMRKSFTAQTKEGDHVSLLEKYRTQYDDLIDRDLMNDLKVIRKNENRGGLVLEASDGARLKTAAAHVVRLSQPEA